MLAGLWALSVSRQFYYWYVSVLWYSIYEQPCQLISIRIRNRSSNFRVAIPVHHLLAVHPDYPYTAIHQHHNSTFEALKSFVLGPFHTKLRLQASHEYQVFCCRTNDAIQNHREAEKLAIYTLPSLTLGMHHVNTLTHLAGNSNSMEELWVKVN